MSLKITFISDTHNYMEEILERLPYDSDVLVHCGDALLHGGQTEFDVFTRTLARAARRFDYVLYTPGNHDKITQRKPDECRKILTDASDKIHMLIDEEIIIDGIKFYGSPWTPEFFYWAWMYDRAVGKDIWSKIPNDVDVLFTHGMPYQIMDEVPRLMEGELEPYVGCKDLRNRINEIKPTIYAGGHLHFSGGRMIRSDGTVFINAAICDEAYTANRQPMTLILNEDKSVSFPTRKFNKE